MTRETESVRIQDGGRSPRVETVAREETVCLYLNGDLLVRLSASPSHLENLAVGFLFSEGFIETPEDILSLEPGSAPTTLFARTNGRGPDRAALAGAVRTSGCGGGVTRSVEQDRLEPVATDVTIPAEEILSLAKDFEASSDLFRRTGGVHSCALASGGGLAVIREDIGRHNALDKVLGAALTEGIPLSGSVILISGRVSSEMVAKTARARVGMIVSRTAPTSTALDMASRLGVCVVGFVRGGRMNVYTHPNRILS